MASKGDDSGPTKRKGRFTDTKDFLYNPATKSVFGRTCSSWAKITVFYIIFYSCLAGVLAACLMAFFTTISDTEPSQTKYQSLIKYNPGMGFRPHVNLETTLINFEQGIEGSYTPYVDSLKAFLDDYSPSNQDSLDPCLGDTKSDGNMACKFDLESLGKECVYDNAYGYDEGKPCVLVKMNKVFFWEPTSYANGTDHLEEDGADRLEGRYDPDSVGVTCQGEGPADKDNIGELEYWPKNGFPSKFFPYQNQPGYLPPVVMVQFKKPEYGTLIKVWCKAWAKNIYHDMNDQAGSVQFELLVD